MDGATKLSTKDNISFQEIIGMLGWEIKIGGVDALSKISLLLQYQVYHIEGHLEHYFIYFTN